MCRIVYLVSRNYYTSPHIVAIPSKTALPLDINLDMTLYRAYRGRCQYKARALAGLKVARDHTQFVTAWCEGSCRERDREFISGDKWN